MLATSPTELRPAELKKRRYLEFEKPLAELDAQIQQLKNLQQSSTVDVSSEVKTLEKKAEGLLDSISKTLSAYQVVQLARHPDRPTTLDYLQQIATDFIELHGDRNFMEDSSIVGGLGRIGGRSCVIIGHQKGRSTQENMQRNFGMPKPEGYRKAMRLMDMAERFKLPLITLIDTPGAYPGIEAEERGQAEAIAESILKMSDLKVPIITVVIGEGGSGGALAIAVCDRMLMLEFSIYSVISPEGCAAITWKDPSFMAQAAEALKLTAPQLKANGIADDIIKEPLGGAHRDFYAMAGRLKLVLEKELEALAKISADDLTAKRYQRYRVIGKFADAQVSDLKVGAR